MPGGMRALTRTRLRVAPGLCNKRDSPDNIWWSSYNGKYSYFLGDF